MWGWYNQNAAGGWPTGAGSVIDGTASEPFEYIIVNQCISFKCVYIYIYHKLLLGSGFWTCSKDSLPSNPATPPWILVAITSHWWPLPDVLHLAGSEEVQVATFLIRKKLPQPQYHWNREAGEGTQNLGTTSFSQVLIRWDFVVLPTKHFQPEFHWFETRIWFFPRILTRGRNVPRNASKLNFRRCTFSKIFLFPVQFSFWSSHRATFSHDHLLPYCRAAFIPLGRLHDAFFGFLMVIQLH